jgi:3-hydroxybutyryl-CoA dehydratase
MPLPAVGDSVKETKFIDDRAIRDFAQVSGDENPIHLNDAYAAKTRFKRRIAHGMIAASMVSKLAGTRLPGPGTIYLSQTYKFKNPAYIGDTIEAEVKVLAVRPDKPIVTLSTICRNQRGETLLEGEAVVFYEPIAEA